MRAVHTYGLAATLALFATTTTSTNSAAGNLPGPNASAAPGSTLPSPDSLRTRLVLLGTGTPNADPDRWGPATAVVVDSTAYLVDCGVGVVRRAAAARRDRHIPALAADRLDRVFITHLHSDHTLGCPDLLLSPWVLDRTRPLQVWGPPGTARMFRLIQQAYSEDIAVRMNGLEPIDSQGWHADVHEVLPGVVYRDSLVTVTAIAVKHGSWTHAYGYRFDTPDRSIVISGDTRPTDSIVRACDGCDILLHEVYSAEMFKRRSAAWQRSHTSTTELAAIAKRAHPGLLVLYHQLFWGATPDQLIAEIRGAGYEGPVVSGKDLDVF
jgi:ribonuclease BN (tRNA processing enzyme)